MCYITLKKKSACIKPHKSDGQDYDETVDEEDNEDGLQIEVEEDLGELEPITEAVPEAESQREGREVNATSEESQNNREARYIDFIDEPVAASSEYDYELQPSEDEDRTYQQNNEWETKTVLVTRIHKYTDHQVTATLIAKNCAPVSQHVPKCKKKRDAVIRDRPDGDTPLIIASAVAPATPPEIKFDAKEIVNEENPAVEEPVEEEPETQTEGV